MRGKPSEKFTLEQHREYSHLVKRLYNDTVTLSTGISKHYAKSDKRFHSIKLIQKKIVELGCLLDADYHNLCLNPDDLPENIYYGQ